MSFGSKPSGTTVTTVNKDPWSVQQPYLETGFEKAGTLLDQPRQFYPYSTVVPFSPATEEALAGTESRARAGSPLTPAAQESTLQTVRGDYLTPESNPFLTSALEAATRPMQERFTQDVLPGISGAFSQAGRYGSGLLANQQQRAAENYLRQIGDVTSAMTYRNYADERARQLEATRMAPAMAELDYGDLQRLGAVGGAREKFAEAQLQEDIDRFAQGQEAEREGLREFMATIGGGQYGGAQTTAQPLYSDPFATGLGYAGTAAGIAGSLFGGGPTQSAFAGLKSLLSDRRLKKNIKLIGEINGLNWYEFDYIWGGPRRIGVMAQEALKIIPEAVFKIGKWLAVDYSKLGAR